MRSWLMAPWFVVFRKEVLESLRDRRTLLSALVMAPLLGPLLLRPDGFTLGFWAAARFDELTLADALAV